MTAPLPQTSAILLSSEAGVLSVTLNRPESRNAMSLAMVSELRAALDYAEADESVRVMVLRGTGGHFCSGGDIRDMSTKGKGDEDPIVAVNAAFGEMSLAYSTTNVPVVAVLEGTVMGGGFGLACVADVALASANASFRLPETSLGLIPAQIAPFLIERLGYSQAKRLAVTGGRLDGKQAFAIGMVHGVAETTAELEAMLDQTLTDIFACAPQANRVTKHLMIKARTTPVPEMIPYAAKTFATAVRSAEGAEGMAAFIGKRPAVWARQAKTVKG